MGVGSRYQRGTILAALGLAALITVGACGASDSDKSTAANDSAEAPAAGQADRAAPGGAANPEKPATGGAGDKDARSEPGQHVEQRSIIYTGSMRVRVDDVDRAAADAVRLVTVAGGFVGGDRRTGEDVTGEANLVLRVPAARFTGVIDQIAALGRQLQRDVNTEDVTEETVDLAARIATQRARVTSGRRLLAQAKNLNELISLENEVAKREADLAALEAKQRRLADLTALSTITVTLVREPARKSVEKKSSNGFLPGLKASWQALVKTLAVLLVVLGVLLPWLVVFGVPLVLVLRWRRRRQRASAPPGTATAAVGGAPAAAVPVPRGAGPTPQPAPPTEPPANAAPSAP